MRELSASCGATISQLEASMQPTRILCVLSMLLIAVICSAQTSPSSSSLPKEIPSFDVTAID
jgi:hypothetical protein